ncbi:hypothetical protein ACQEVB_27010 [Pseudonocardia sp. CA-107938]|uniref:hypothetical protein n=1 Tax=Pseudonocardia sp. CA-107938 TaxID=3240021 RepID=UPI003D8C854B
MDDRLRGPVTAIRRHARAVAVAGAVVAVGAATVMTVTIAEAAEAGTCTDNVNVRAEPKSDARIVTLCKRGTAVKVGATKNGFVELPALHGWAAQEYVEVGGHTPRAPVERSGEPAAPKSSGSAGDDSGSASGRRSSRSSAEPTATPHAARSSSDHDEADGDDAPRAGSHADRDDDEDVDYRPRQGSAQREAAPRRIGLLG